MRNAASDILVANTRFQGVSGFGYFTLRSSNLIIPLIASAVISEFHTIKL